MTFSVFGFDAVCSFGRPRAEMIYTGKYKRISQIFLRKLIPQLKTLCLDYPEVMKHCFAPEDSWENVYPNIMPQWDRSPRAGNMDGVFVNATPENFKKHILQALEVIKDKKPEHKILFLRSWNEWGEGNYVEPDELYGHGFLDAIHETVWE